jgi:ABC-type lipoprotein release transport system permease subunit
MPAYSLSTYFGERRMDGKRQKQSLNVGLGIALGVAIGMFVDNVAMGIAIGLALGIALSWETKQDED